VLCRPVRGDNINLVQQYNEHYGFFGGKVKHVLQADGMCYSFVCHLCQYDEYLYSGNHNLLLPLPRAEEEDDNFRNKEESERMHHHIIFLRKIIIYHLRIIVKIFAYLLIHE